MLPHDEAIAAIKDSIRKTYAKKGEEIVQMNLAAVDQTLAQPARGEGARPHCQRRSKSRQPVAGDAPAFVRDVLGPMIAGRGDCVPVSALPCDGTFPTGTSQWEKRNLAAEVPVWDPDICIQCGKCVMVCPHAVIRSKVYEPAVLDWRAGDVQVARRAAAGVEGLEVHAPGRGRGLHWLRHLR